VNTLAPVTSRYSAVDTNGGSVEVGDTITYTLTLTNTGTIDLSGIDVSDVIDADTENLTNVVIGANGSSCGGSTTNNSTSTNFSVSDISLAS